MTQLYGFAPVAGKDAQVLILGSMPGSLSLQAQQYYAHPRNVFWQIMEALFDIASDAPYQTRLNGLIDNKIALWDVIKTCHRSGSLDTAIDKTSIEVNDFAGFFHQQPRIQTLFFNGLKAEQVYCKSVRSALPHHLNTHHLQRLPSSSPANAQLTLAEKIAKWRVLI